MACLTPSLAKLSLIRPSCCSSGASRTSRISAGETPVAMRNSRSVGRYKSGSLSMTMAKESRNSVWGANVSEPLVASGMCSPKMALTQAPASAASSLVSMTA